MQLNTLLTSDWNETSIRRVEEKGRDAAAGDKYRGTSLEGPSPAPL